MSDPGPRARIHGPNGCRHDSLAKPGTKRFPEIRGSVGRGGNNLPDDTKKIQQALNRIPALLGGPVFPLAVDGLVGPKTTGAIVDFQTFHFGVKKADGRVDPENYTIFRLRDLNTLIDQMGAQNAIIFWSLRQPIRLGRMRAGVVEAKAAVAKGRRRLESAMDHLRGQPDSFGFNASAYRVADVYFAFGKMTSESALSALARIRLSFISVQIALDNRGKGLPGIPNGEDVFQIDPVGKPHVAYSPRVSVAHDDGTDPYQVYLCDGIDPLVPDHFNHVLIHELFHATDVETQALEIDDFGYREGAMKLPHFLRMRNSDNYALFATHCHIGRARLVASQPTLAPHVPETI